MQFFYYYDLYLIRYTLTPILMKKLDADREKWPTIEEIERGFMAF